MVTATSQEYPASHSDVESGYASASSSEDCLTEVFFTKPHLKYLNKQLQMLEPEEILKWSILSIPNLFQTTAFGLTGLVTIDMLSRLSLTDNSPIELIFLDTLYHFSETLDLVSRVQARYPNVKLHIYKPQDIDSAQQFESKYGAQLWETNDNRYDFLAKVEPAQRAYAELGVRAVLTGRRKSQGGKRGSLDIIEVDDAGIIKINPLANWSFAQVKKYVDEHNVPYNILLDQGYKSVGDWHSTQPVKEGEDERAGRWAGKEKSECGIHNSRSVYAQYLEEMDRKERETQAMMNNQYPYGEASELEGLPIVAEDPVAEAIEESHEAQTAAENKSAEQQDTLEKIVSAVVEADVSQAKDSQHIEPTSEARVASQENTSSSSDLQSPLSSQQEPVHSPLQNTHLQSLVSV